MVPIPVEHSYVVPTGQSYYQSGQQQMYPVGQYGHELYGYAHYMISYVLNSKLICIIINNNYISIFSPGPHPHGMLVNPNNQIYMDQSVPPGHSNKMVFCPI